MTTLSIAASNLADYGPFFSLPLRVVRFPKAKKNPIDSEGNVTIFHTLFSNLLLLLLRGTKWNISRESKITSHYSLCVPPPCITPRLLANFYHPHQTDRSRKPTTVSIRFAPDINTFCPRKIFLCMQCTCPSTQLGRSSFFLTIKFGVFLYPLCAGERQS